MKNYKYLASYNFWFSSVVCRLPPDILKEFVYATVAQVLLHAESLVCWS